MWCLPESGTTLQSAGCDESHAWGLVMAADQCGFSLTSDMDLNLGPDLILRQQIAAFAQSVGCRMGSGHVSLSRMTSEGSLQFEVEPGQELLALDIQPMVEKLNALRPGLGWHITGILDGMTRHGCRIYGLGWLLDEAKSHVYEAQSTLDLMHEIGEISDDTEWHSKSEDQQSDAMSSFLFMPEDIPDLFPFVKLKPGAIRKRIVPLPDDADDDARLFVNAMIEVQRAAKNCKQWINRCNRVQIQPDEKSSDEWNLIEFGACAYIHWGAESIGIELIEHHEMDLMQGDNGIARLFKRVVPDDLRSARVLFHELKSQLRLRGTLDKSFGLLLPKE